MCNLTDEEGNEVPVTVIEYVINDLKEDDLAFHNPLHRQILSEATAHMATKIIYRNTTLSPKRFAIILCIPLKSL